MSAYAKRERRPRAMFTLHCPRKSLCASTAVAPVGRYSLSKSKTQKAFPPIRVFGTIGFIVSMWIVDLMGFQHGYEQFFVSAMWSMALGAYAFTLPPCAVNKARKAGSMVDVLGLRAFALFKQKKMAIFFCFSMLLGVSLQLLQHSPSPQK